MGDDRSKIVVVNDQRLSQIGLGDRTQHQRQHHGCRRDPHLFQDITQQAEEKSHSHSEHGVLQRIGAHQNECKDQRVQGGGLYIQDAHEQGERAETNAHQNDISQIHGGDQSPGNVSLIHKEGGTR